jgi:hypothetical protein
MQHDAGGTRSSISRTVRFSTRGRRRVIEGWAKSLMSLGRMISPVPAAPFSASPTNDRLRDGHAPLPGRAPQGQRRRSQARDYPWSKATKQGSRSAPRYIHLRQAHLHTASSQQLRAFRAIQICRAAALGRTSMIPVHPVGAKLSPTIHAGVGTGPGTSSPSVFLPMKALSRAFRG